MLLEEMSKSLRSCRGLINFYGYHWNYSLIYTEITNSS